MSGGPGPTAEGGPSLLIRLRAAVGPKVRVDIYGNNYVAKAGAPTFKTIASRSVKLVQNWRNPESTFAFVVRWEKRMKGIA